MTLLRLFKNTKPPAVGIQEEEGTSLGEAQLLSKGIFLLLASGLGILMALLIARGSWLLALGVLLSIPAIIVFSAYPFAAIIVWLLVNSFLQTTPDDMTRMAYWMMHRALPPAALGVAVLADLFKVNTKRPRVKLGGAELSMVIFVGVALLNILWYHPSGYLSHLYNLYDQLFIPFCLYGLIRLTAPREQDLNRLIPGAFALVVFEVIVGILSWLRPEVLPRDWVGYSSQRTIGTFGFAHAYSTTLVFFSLLLFQAAMHRKSGVTRTVLLLAVGMGVAGVFFSFSRGGWLGGLAAATGLLIMYPKTVLRLSIILLLVMSILGMTVLSGQMAFADERMNSDDTAKIRWVLWDAGLQMIYAKPFFGWGYSDYKLYAWRFQERVFNFVASREFASHNTLISIAAELGVPALLLFLFPVGWWLRRTRKVWSRLPRAGFWSRSLLVAFWLVILDHLITGFFSDMRTSIYGQSMWWVTLGFIANMVDAYLPPDKQQLPAQFLQADQLDTEAHL